MNKFEQLIEFVINDEEQKARELFHDIVVEKSRAIYESLMNEEADEEIEEAAEEEGEEEELDESFGEPQADSADNLVTDVEMDEVSMAEADEEESEDDSEEMSFGGEEEGEAEPEELEDRVVDLEDKLDELMAEFEAMMGGEGSEEQEFDMDAGGDAIEMDDTSEIMPEMGMMENVDLKAAPKPVTTEPAGTNSRSTVAANSGAKGMQGSPVRMTGDTAQGRPAPSVKDMGMTTSPKQGAAPKPVTTQAAGVNTKSPV